MTMMNLKIRNFIILLFTWGCFVVFINIVYVNNNLIALLDSSSLILNNNNNNNNAVVHNDNFRINNPKKKSKKMKMVHLYGGGVAANNNNNNKNQLEEKKQIDDPKKANKHDEHNEQHEQHQIAGLNCNKYGGPTQDIASEMVYWKDIPSDSNFVSPFKSHGRSKSNKRKYYLTFEPDRGGWNNIRMGMETAIALAYATGRTLVLPMEGKMYLLDKEDDPTKRNNRFTFKEFFHLDTIAKEHYKNIEIISMEEFLQIEVMSGKFINKTSKQSMFPPGNKTTDWDGNVKKGKEFWHWLRNAAATPIWYNKNCVVGFDSQPGGKYNDDNSTSQMKHYYEKVKEQRRLSTKRGDDDRNVYYDNPTPVDATPSERLGEMLYGNHKKICHYDKYWQEQKVLHFMGDKTGGARLLVHFYAYIFFENWQHDLLMKRFIRDHLRYIDEIQCAAARIVHKMKQIAKKNGNPDGNFDTFHIRRGDFQYESTRISAEEIINNTKDILVEKNSTIFIATDEKDLDFFIPFQNYHSIYFLKDFNHLYEGINKNYYGMLDQLVASKGNTFIGSYYSTFTGYINRMRGYHSQKNKKNNLPGHNELGSINSYFYTPHKKLRKDKMKHYFPLDDAPLWATEFPIAWRDIDHDVIDVIV